ncbi:hypothetical protein BC829DRAFT_54341 [Chytridium lagenaria]|nr:hypothetical protein BC829DRAFT_54341 [Chytridium lagenaria]
MCYNFPTATSSALVPPTTPSGFVMVEVGSFNGNPALCFPLVCCGNECVASSDAKCFPPIDPNCRGVQDYQTVCTSRQLSTTVLIKGFYAFSADQSCAAGTVCCPSTGRCVFESQCTILTSPLPCRPAHHSQSPAQPPVTPEAVSAFPTLELPVVAATLSSTA